MKKIISLFALSGLAMSAILPIALTTQKHDQWCWVGTTTSIINYYGTSVKQCDIANFTRTQVNATSTPFHDFGTTDCCADTTTFNMSQANGSCNYWNYNWGNSGSIQDILNHWNITNGTLNGTYTTSQVDAQINAGHPFIIRYGWTSGGGHFIVGRGFDSGTQNMYLMNPWPGDGYQIVAYNTVVSASDHNWTHTNTISKAPPTGSSIVVSSNTGTSSVALSSAVKSSSSTAISSIAATSSTQVGSSQSGQTVNCSGVNVWNSNTIYSNSGTKVTYQNALYSNNYWTQNNTPSIQGTSSDPWSYLGQCASVVKVISNLTVAPIQLITANSHSVEWNGTEGVAQVQVLNSLGEVEQKAYGDNKIQWNRALQQGFHLIQIQDAHQNLLLWVNIQK